MRHRFLAVGGHLALDLQDIGQAPVFETVAEVCVRAVAGVRDQGCGPQTDPGQFVEHVQSELPLGAVVFVIGDPAGPAACGGFGPVPRGGQEQPPGQRARGGVGSGVDADADLAVADLAQSARVLPGHPG